MQMRVAKGLRRAAIAFLIAVVLISTFVLAKTVSPGEIQQSVSAVRYSHSAAVNYRVFFLANSLYPERSLEAGHIYVSSLVDYIDTFIRYEFSADRPSQVKGWYDVRATLDAWEKEVKQPIWQREWVLVSQTEISGNVLELELPVKYMDYDALVKKIVEEAKFSPQQLRLVVSWNISVEAQTDMGVIKEKLTPKMEIPLGGRYFAVTGDLNPGKQGSIDQTITITAPVDQKKAMLYGAILTVSVMLLTFVLRFTTDVKDVDPEQMKLKQILKTHADRLVAIDREIIATPDQIMPVKTMEDLIRIADELGRPVIYEGRGTASATFYVMDDHAIFTYVYGESGYQLHYPPVDSTPSSRVLRRSISRGTNRSTGV